MNETCCSQEQKFTNEDKIIIIYYICAMTCFNSVFLKAYKKQELSSNLHTVYKSSLPLKKHWEWPERELVRDESKEPRTTATLKCAKNNLGKDCSYWKCIIWWDEMKLELFGHRQKGEAYNPNSTVPTVKHSGGSVMMWGWFNVSGTGNVLKNTSLVILSSSVFREKLQTRESKPSLQIFGCIKGVLLSRICFC